MPLQWYAGVGVAAGLIVAGFFLVGGHHEVAYLWRQRRQRRPGIVDLRVRR